MSESNGLTSESSSLSEALEGVPANLAARLRQKYAKLLLWRLTSQTQDMDRLFRYDDELRRKTDQSLGIPMDDFDEDAVVLADDIKISHGMPGWAVALFGLCGVGMVAAAGLVAWSLLAAQNPETTPPVDSNSDTIVRIVE